MDEILRTAIDKHKALILEPRILEVINGKSLLEDESEIKVRIDSEFYVEKSGKLYFPLHFDYKFTESQKNHPELSLEETVLFAAKRELKEWNNRREAIVWFDRAYEQIVDDYALLLAYREIYDLHYKTRTPFEGVSEFDSLRDDDIEELEVVSTGAKEQREASYMAIQGENKEILIKEFTEFLLNGDYVDTIDNEVIKQHFEGIHGLQKMNFIKDLSLLVRLMDSLVDNFHLRFKDKRVKTTRIEPIAIHFSYDGEEITKYNWEKTRHRDKGVYGSSDPHFLPIEKFVALTNQINCPS